MIESFIDSALIIDDKPAEIENLSKELEKKQILHAHFLPATLDRTPKQLKNRKIIFLDLYVDDKLRNVTEQISFIRKLFKSCVGNNFGTYGIVLWTKHEEEVEEFKKRFHNNNSEYKLPLFIVSLDKNKYLKESFDSLISDLDKKLQENIASNFLISWYNGVSEARDKTIDSIYSICGDFQHQAANLRFALFLLAKNHTGIHFDEIEKTNYPLYKDSFHAFNAVLEYELSNVDHKTSDFFPDFNSIKYFGTDAQIQSLNKSVKDDLYHKEIAVVRKGERYYANETEVSTAHVIRLDKEINAIKAALNTRIHLDAPNSNKDSIVPGNIYQILSNDNPLNIPSMPANALRIVAEVSPPCDYAQRKKIKSRFVSGAICDLSGENIRKFKAENFYAEMHPIEISGSADPKMIVFDFRYITSLDDSAIKDEKQFKLVFRAKDKFFADLFQKLSAYMARLGLAIIH